MIDSGHTCGRLTAAVLIFSAFSAFAADAAEKPTPRATQARGRLGAVGSEIVLDRSVLGQHDGIVQINNQTVERMRAAGALTICSPGTASTVGPQAERDGAGKKDAVSEQELARRKRSWQKRVAAQRKRVSKAEADLAVLDAKIDSQEALAFDAGSGAVKLWARLRETRGRRKVAEERLRQERTELASIIREARQEGAQPGWFR